MGSQVWAASVIFENGLWAALFFGRDGGITNKAWSFVKKIMWV